MTQVIMLSVDSEEDFYYLGRNDRQVKINGHRVELDEVESLLEDHIHIQKAYCFVMNGLIIAAIELDSTAKKQGLTMSEIERNSSLLLSGYLMPKHFLCVNDWPLTSNNKLDVDAIEKWANKELSQTKVKKSTNLCDIKDIAESVINKKIDTPDKGLFDVGFDSMTLVELHKNINNILNLDISLIDIYSLGSISKIDEHIKSNLNFRK